MAVLYQLYEAGFKNGYCKTLTFRVTLFSRAYSPGHIHEGLFSQL